MLKTIIVMRGYIIANAWDTDSARLPVPAATPLPQPPPPLPPPPTLFHT